MEITFFIGRLIFAAYWIMSGMNHLTKTKMLTEYARSVGVPSPKAGTIISGLMMVVSGVLLILGVYIELAVVLLVIFLLLANFTVHKFWKIDDAMQRMPDMVNFMKNFALIGALLMLLMISQPWAFSVNL